MNFSEKTLLVSGCSFTAGGGLQREDIFEYNFPSHIGDKEKYFEGGGGQSIFTELIYNSVWGYHLHKKLNTKNYYNLAKCGSGQFSSLHRLYRFIYERIDCTEDTIIVYQIPAHNRVENVVTISDDEKFFTSQWGLDQWDTKLHKIFFKHLYDDAFYFYKMIMDCYNFKTFCESVGIELIFLDWMSFFERGCQDFENFLSMYSKDSGIYTEYEGQYTDMYDFKQVDINHYIGELKTNLITLHGLRTTNNGYIKDEELFCTDDFGNIVDYHAGVNGHKLIANQLFEKKLKKYLDN